MVNYMRLTQDPLSEIVEDTAVDIDLLHEFQRATHYRFGEYEQTDKFHDSEITKLWEHVHKQEDIDREHDKEIAAAVIGREALNDYIKDIDHYGSRRWVAPLKDNN